MSTRLTRIEIRAELAKEANWSASALARNCHISLRTLERYFTKELAKSPKKWLAEQRQREAWRLLREGLCVKQVAAIVGYNHPNQFSRDFKKHWGCTLCHARQSVLPEPRATA